MTYSKLFDIPLNNTQLKSQPLFGKRIVKARGCPDNRRKIQVKLGQIVYYHNGRKIIPMRVFCIDDCSLWSKSFSVAGTKTNRKDFMIYYDLQPLTKKHGRWRALPYRQRTNLNWLKHNRQLWNNNWIGHSVDMDQFALTYAEAQWMRMWYT